MLHRIVTRAVSVFLLISLTGCSQVEEEPPIIRPLPVSEEAPGSAVQSDSDNRAQSADFPMSGRYRVGGDGKLLRPEDAPIPPKPDYPEAARFETPEGAEAFIHYVIDSYEYMVVSGDTKEFEKLCLPTSKWCRVLSEKRAQTQKDGGWVEAVDLTAIHVQFPFEIEDHPGLWNSEIELKTNKLITYENGKIIDQNPSVAKRVLQMRFKEGRWVIETNGKAE